MRNWPARALRAARRLVSRDDMLAQPWTAGDRPRVLFVSGERGVPQRYRVLHQAEQLALQGIAHACYDDSDLRLLRHVARCDVLYLYRARNTPLVRRLVRAARARRTPVVYDTDDLIWTERLIEYCALEERYTPAEVRAFRALFRRTAAIMAEADAFVASTRYLADAIGAHFGRPVYISPNAVSQRAVALSTPLFARRMAARPGEAVTLAYFSGWPKAHEPDLAVALPAIGRVLKALPQARLRIVGHFDVAAIPAPLRQQVVVAPFVPWEQLFESIAGVDINLAPIVDNPHRRSKSAVKFLEAALVGTPTVASNLEPYRGIVHGRTGFLAGDDDAWYASIMALAASEELRRAVGGAAREHVLAHDTTAARAAGFAELIREIAGESRREG